MTCIMSPTNHPAKMRFAKRTPSCPAGPETDCDDPTCVEDPACITSKIPAASTWGLVTMVAALLTCGTYVIRRRATRAE